MVSEPLYKLNDDDHNYFISQHNLSETFMPFFTYFQCAYRRIHASFHIVIEIKVSLIVLFTKVDKRQFLNYKSTFLY